jgi:CheY-like chemotaxis protein
MPNVSVLIVDDIPVNRDIMRNFFKFFGRKCPLQIDEAASGHEAVERAKNHSYDLILMDVHMESPEAGLAATRLIRRFDPTAKIWAVTAHALERSHNRRADREKCLSAGCDLYFSKPLSQRDLLSEIVRELDLELPDRFQHVLIA